MDKKAAELTLTTVIVAILVLLVLALLAYILLGTGKDWKTNTACIKEGGSCKSASEGCNDPTNPQNSYRTSSSCGSGQVCCILQNS